MSAAFPVGRRRGRPKHQPSTETGTPELLFKRAYQETMEAIDLCLERDIINDKQHSYGLHLRWLHTIRFGAPGVSAFDLTRIYGYDAGEEDDPRWRQAREAEYQEAIAQLHAIGRFDPVIQVCVYNERPFYLNRRWLTSAFDNRRLAGRIEREIMALREGLDALVVHWQKSGH